MEYLLVSTTEDLASQNIKNRLEELKEQKNCDFKIFETDKKLTRLSQNDLPDSDCYIFLSKHRSESGKPTLTVHTPGNLTEDNSFGGNKEEICPCDPVLNTILLNKISEYNSLDEYSPLNFEVSFEVVHHGPSDLRAPAVFVEIGSSEKEWVIEEAGEIIAKSVIDTLNILKNKEFEEKEKIIGLGGGHYSSKFIRRTLSGDYYIGYLTPKYAQLSERVLEQLLEKQEFDCVVFDWKGLRGDDKRKYIEFFENKGVEWKKI